MACAGPISISHKHGPQLTRCRQCLPCRIQNQSELMLACLLENHSAWSGSFLTLTYSEAPDLGGYKDMQMFLDRLRVKNRRQGNSLPIRYLAIGEYGDTFGRFHYHALIWNSVPFSPEVWDTKLWPHGFSKIGTISPASIRYTTRYTLKFLSKDQNDLPRGRSKRPPLGEIFMRSLGEKALSQGHQFQSPPSSLKWAGRTWPVSNALQIAFQEGYSPDTVLRDAAGTRKLANSAVAGNIRYTEQMLLGDPLKKWRQANEAKFLRKHRELERGLAL